MLGNAWRACELERKVIGHSQFGLLSGDLQLRCGARVFAKVTEGDTPRMWIWRLCASRHVRDLSPLAARLADALAGDGFSVTFVGNTGDGRQAEFIGRLAGRRNVRKDRPRRRLR